ncbi:MAG: protease modulator HflK [Chthoniobacterales bacterium]|nr:protease modulator HflK [Chthoniobacterales bacterium]
MKKKREDALFSAHAILAALRSSIRILRWGMLVLVLIYLCSGITVIAPNERGLVLRFGRALPKTAPPGLLLAWPAPIDEIVRLPAKSVQDVALEAWAGKADGAWRDSIHPARDPYTISGDVNIIRARFSVRFQIADPITYEFAASERDTLRDAILYQSACRTLAAMNVDDILTTRREHIGQEAMRLAQAEMDRLGLGVQLLAFETREINPPATVLPAFQDVVSAKVQAQTMVEPARSRAATVIPEAKAEAYRIQQQADAYAQGLMSKAHGEVSSFLALLKEYRANSETVRTRLYAEMIEEVLPKLRVSTVLPSSGAPVRLLIEPQKGDPIYPASDEATGSIQVLPTSTPYPPGIQPMETKD